MCGEFDRKNEKETKWNFLCRFETNDKDDNNKKNDTNQYHMRTQCMYYTVIYACMHHSHLIPYKSQRRFDIWAS